MTVGHLLNEMSSYELSLWIAYAKVEAEKYDGENKKPETPLDPDDPIPVDVKPGAMLEQSVKGCLERKGVHARKLKIADADNSS